MQRLSAVPKFWVPLLGAPLPYLREFYLLSIYLRLPAATHPTFKSRQLDWPCWADSARGAWSSKCGQASHPAAPGVGGVYWHASTCSRVARPATGE